MQHRIKVGDEFRAFELSFENILEADQRFGIKIYNGDFLPPISLSSMGKFAVIGFMAEDPNVSKSTALKWLQKADEKAVAAAVVDAFKRLNKIEDEEVSGEAADPLDPPSSGTKSGTSESES